MNVLEMEHEDPFLQGTCVTAKKELIKAANLQHHEKRDQCNDSTDNIVFECPRHLAFNKIFWNANTAFGFLLE